MIYDLIFVFILISCSLLIKKVFNKWLWIVPVSFITGILGLFVYNQNFYLVDQSQYIHSYLEIFLAVIFTTFPLSISKLEFSLISKVKPLWKFSLLQYFSQWGLSLLLTLTLLRFLWPTIQDSIATAMPGGFAGGFGSAAVLGSIFKSVNIENIQSLIMSMATIGVFSSVIGGLAWIIWGMKTKKVNHFQIANKASNKGNYKVNIKTILSISIIVFVSALLLNLIENYISLKLPLFIICIVISLLIKSIFKSKLELNQDSLKNIAKYATDLLVIFGIMSIKIEVVSLYIGPLVLLAIVGICLCIFNFLFLAPKILKENSFEKGIFTWGWSMGGLVFGLALVNIISTKENSRVLLQEFALTYLLVAPFEMGLILSMPYLIVSGYAIYAAILLILLALYILKTELKYTDK